TFSDGTVPFTTNPQITTQRPAFRSLVQQERVQTLLDRLRTTEFTTAAAELLAVGAAAIPALVDALEWRDMEMRRRAFEVLQRLWPGVVFEPFAPESDRVQQLAMVRAHMDRKAG